MAAPGALLNFTKTYAPPQAGAVHRASRREEERARGRPYDGSRVSRWPIVVGIAIPLRGIGFSILTIGGVLRRSRSAGVAAGRRVAHRSKLRCASARVSSVWLPQETLPPRAGYLAPRRSGHGLQKVAARPS